MRASRRRAANRNTGSPRLVHKIDIEWDWEYAQSFVVESSMDGATWREQVQVRRRRRCAREVELGACVIATHVLTCVISATRACALAGDESARASIQVRLAPPVPRGGAVRTRDEPEQWAGSRPRLLHSDVGGLGLPVTGGPRVTLRRQREQCGCAAELAMKIIISERRAPARRISACIIIFCLLMTDYEYITHYYDDAPRVVIITDDDIIIISSSAQYVVSS